MDKVQIYRITVTGGEMTVEDFALEILRLVNWSSSIKESIVKIKTYEGTNTVTVDSYKDISNELRMMFNADNVEVEPLHLYIVDPYDLSERYAREIDNYLEELEENVLIIGENLTTW